MSQTIEEFTESYTKLLVAAWSDDAFAARLHESPRDVANEVGMDIPSDVDVDVVVPTDHTRQDLGEYYRDFEESLAAGSVEIIVPAAPMVDLQDLNAADLADIAGGAACCCCCPCCCCS